jgi:uncharacterized membrane protein YraQ (UPF0718 family)
VAVKIKENACQCSPTFPVHPDKENGNREWKIIFLLAACLAIWILLYFLVEPVANLLTYSLFQLPADSHLGSSVAFFLYEAPKVILLLTVIIFGVGIIRSFFTPERTRQLLAGKREFAGNVLAGGLGIVTPFCSCSAIPLFIGFVETGVPLGVTFTFLIAAPMINEVAIVLLFSMFGWKIALLYVATGLFIAITAGWVIGRLKLERYIESWVFDIKIADSPVSGQRTTFEDRLRYGLNAVREIVGKVWPYVLAGIAVGAVIHGYVPEGLMASFMGKDVWWAVPAAVLLGVPMYSNAAGVIPVVQALVEKGAALGTSLAFMMAVIGLSLPETIILRKVLKWPLIGIFIGVVAVGIIIIGYLFNAML